MNFPTSLVRASVCGLLISIAALAAPQTAAAQTRPAAKSPRPNDLGEANRLSQQAELYRSQGKYGEAEPLLKQALAITEKALGPDSPSVAVLLNNLASLNKLQGRFTEAQPLCQRALDIEPLQKRALAINEKALGPNHPDVANVATGLALVLHELGRDAEAKVYEDQAARIRAGNARQPGKM